ncbi:hypothetical protein [Latilactobacillus sakei]|uniref:hypothetical protein n=1 Tax=Latilactobacillus sakei TaxID=1599 RepID=UPI0031339B42
MQTVKYFDGKKHNIIKENTKNVDRISLVNDNCIKVTYQDNDTYTIIHATYFEFTNDKLPTYPVFNTLKSQGAMAND